VTTTEVNTTDQATVCSDGSDDVTFVAGAVVGCDTSWEDGGIVNAKLACGTGYSICPDNTYAEALGLTYDVCANVPDAGNFYASYETSGGNWDCNTNGSNDLWGCGKDGNGVNFQSSTCGAFNKAIGNQDYGSWTGLTSRTNEVHEVTKAEGNGGVLCCADGVPVNTTEADQVPAEPEETNCTLLDYDFANEDWFEPIADVLCNDENMYTILIFLIVLILACLCLVLCCCGACACFAKTAAGGEEQSALLE
jgi:hypothetical protein